MDIEKMKIKSNQDGLDLDLAITQIKQKATPQIQPPAFALSNIVITTDSRYFIVY